MLLSLLGLFLVLKDLLLGFLVLFFGLLLGIDFGLLFVQLVLQLGLLVVLLFLLLFVLFLLLLFFLLSRGVVGLVIAVIWGSVVSAAVETWAAGGGATGGGAGAPLGAGGSVCGIRLSGAESSVRNVPDATVISFAPGRRTWTNASRAMMAAAASTACTRRARLLAPTAILRSRTLISRSESVAITHGAGLF